MPKLIVQDGDQKRAFRLSKGRLTLGSADSNKLVLTSDGVEPEHAVLTIREEAATLDALAAVEIDGERATGDGLAVPIGAVIRIGGAAIALRKDDAATKEAPAKAGTSARGAARGGSARAGSARSGSARAGGSSRRGASGARSRRGGGDDEDGGRPGRRGNARSSGRPAWVMPLIIGFALVIVGIGIAMASGSGAENYLNQAIQSVNAGEYDRARTAIDKVQRASLPPGRFADYDDIAERIEIQEQQADVDGPRAKASKWADQFLIRFVPSYLSEETRTREADNGRENYTKAKMRTWFDRFEEFQQEWPNWNSAAWRHRQNWADKADELIAIRDDFAAQVDPDAPMTAEDVEWAMFYFTDPSAKKGNRFDKAKETLEAYRAAGGSGSIISDNEALIAERANAYADYFLELARDTYAVAEKQNAERNSDAINRQHLTSVNHLLLVARYSAIPERANEALDFLEKFPDRVGIMKSYVKAAQGGSVSDQEKVEFLSARPTFRNAIEQAREELAEAEAARAAQE